MTLELKDCTFKPNLTTKAFQKIEITEEELGNEIYMRNLNWEQKKQERIKEEIEKKKE